MTNFVGTDADETLDLLTIFQSTGTVYSTVYMLNGIDTITNYAESSAADFAGVGATGIFINSGGSSDVISLRNADNSTINGGTGNDSFAISSTDNALVLGGEGNDNFTTFNEFVDHAGEVQLHGTTNADYRGGSGADTFNLYAVTDAVVSGGIGSDIINASFGSTDSFFKGDSGNDIITVEGTNNIVSGGAGNDTITILNGDGTASASGGTNNDYISREFLEILNDGSGLVDTYDLPTDYSAYTSILRGNSGNDTILGGHVDGDPTVDVTSVEIVLGGTGDDQVFTFGGDDKLYGQTGNDTLDGGDGDDFLNGGDGNDHLFGGFGNDFIRGGDGNDVINDISTSSTSLDVGGDDRLIGGAGDDVITSTGGVDRIDGGAGDDLFVFFPLDGTTHTIINDFTQGEDLLYFIQFNPDLTINLTPLDSSNYEISETSNGNTNISFDNGNLIQLKAFTGLTEADFFTGI